MNRNVDVDTDELFRASERDMKDMNVTRLIEVDVDTHGFPEDHPLHLIRELQFECWGIADNKGWHDEHATFGDRIALIHSEASEALEAFRDGHDPQESWLGGKDGMKPEGVPSELADVIIRALDLAEIYDIDLAVALDLKMAYNRTRPYRHEGKRI